MADATNTSIKLISDFPAGQFAGLQYGSPDEIERVQLKLLSRHLGFASKNSPFYKKTLASASFDFRDIKKISDISGLPFTDKEDMNNPNNSFTAVRDKDIADICLTSGSTGGTPTIIAQTQSDLARLACNEELAFDMAGITEDDTLLICAALDKCFMAGLAYFLGGLKRNARIVRGGAGSAAQQYHLLKITRANVIIGVPSLLLKIAQYALENGEDPSKSGVTKLIAIGEPVRNKELNLVPVGEKLEELWGADIYSTYASSELATTFCECAARQGGHLRPELIVLEIVDDSGRPVADGTPGEVVVTPLGITGMPLIRFKTGDISFVIRETCSCGRTTPRLAPIIGRKNQMLKYKGTTVFPNAILAALEGKEPFYGGYIEAKLYDDGSDKVILHAAVKDSQDSLSWLKNELRAQIRVVPEIILASKEEIDNKVFQFDKKRKRTTFFDFRNKN